MTNAYFDWPAVPTADRFVAFDTVRSADVNEVFDLVSAGFDKLPTLAQMWGGSGNYVVAAGATDAWTATLAASYLTAYTDGLAIRVKFPDPNTVGSPTLNLNGLGAKTIVREGNTALSAGDLPDDGIVTLIYNATYGKWQLAQTSVASANAAVAAAGSASAAATSAGASSTSASASSTSAAAALVSQNAAAASATAAGTSATSASTSATTATAQAAIVQTYFYMNYLGVN